MKHLQEIRNDVRFGWENSKEKGRKKKEKEKEKERNCK
jgi:hypothetical protein